MSHEIRTPLNGVIGLANLLASSPLNQRQAQLVDNLARSGRTLLALINDILDFSRIEAHELELFEAPFEIREVVAEVTDLFAEQCASKGLELIYAVAEDVPVQLLGDAVRLRQVLINLVGNAMKFTERGEILIELSVARQEGTALLLDFSVDDTGIGIAADKLDQVFEPFRQADASMTRARGGSGLGLAISKRLVELLGGEIGADSILDEGSRFHFTARVRRVAAAPEPGRHIARKLRALLVDTNAVSARVTRQYLAGWRIEPTVVETAGAALMAWRQAIAAGAAFDAAIIDLKGLAAEGVALARAIRSDSPGTAGRDGAGAAIILLVGMNNLADDAEIEGLGAFATLTKPARPSALFDCFAAIAAGRSLAPLAGRRGARAAEPSFDARVLVVEDNPVNQEVARGILEAMDCRVAIAVNGRIALDMLARDTFDLILMDCEMPVMDGFEAARHIRDDEADAASAGVARHVPIVALTAHALAEIREKCLLAGMDDFIVKPFDELQIGEMLRRWIPFCERPGRERAGPGAERAGDAVEAASAVIDLGTIAKIRAIGGDGSALFERVVGQFADTAPSLSATLRTHYDAGDADAVWRTAHSLKSSAAALGANRLSRRCAEIEALARERGVQAIGALLDALDAELNAAQNGLRALLATGRG